MARYTVLNQYFAGAPQRRSSRPDGWLRSVPLVASSTQEALDRITSLAGEALDVPAVCVSLVDANRRVVTSCFGLPLPTALLLSHAFRKQVVGSHSPLVVGNGRRDPLVSRNPAVRDGTVTACVGMPLRAADGRAVGTLLAMDQKPREWTAPQVDFLGRLSALIMSEMELGWLVGAGRR